MKRLLKIILLSLITSFLLIGCSEYTPVAVDSSPAKIEGRVTGSSGFGSSSSSAVEGASITLARITSNGSFETVSSSSVTTDNVGKFIIETDATASSDLVVVAKKDGKEWKTVVTSQIQPGITVYSQPLNDETDTETEIYAFAKASTPHANYSDISALIDVDMVAKIKGSAGKAKIVSDAFIDEAETHYSIISKSAVGITENQYRTMVKIKANAQATLERNLHFASTDASVNAAINAYFDEVAESYSGAGVAADKSVKLLEISHRAFSNKAVTAGPVLKFELAKKAAMLRIRLLNQALDLKFKVLNASISHFQSIASFSVKLNQSIKNCKDDDKMNEAFNQFYDEILEVLLAVIQKDPIAFASFKLKINGHKLKFKAKINNAATLEALLTAFLDYFNDIKGEVAIDFPDAPVISNDATAELVAITNSHM